MNTRSVQTGVLLVVVIGVLASPAHACPVCYGAADSPANQGMNLAIMSLLGVTGSVLAAFVSMFLHIRRRARALAQEHRLPESYSENISRGGQ
jgi:hypothetical protein